MTSSEVRHLSLSILLDDIPEDLRKTLVKSLKPEMESEMRGVRASISLVEDGVKIEIHAPSHSAFRAALNSALRLSSTVLNLIDELRMRNLV